MTDWIRQSSPSIPPPGDVDVWMWSAIVAGDDALLSHDERLRARAMRRDSIRNRWIAHRTALRRILGECLGIAPAEVRFRYGPHGKPELETPAGLSFNTSHTGDTGVVAISAAGRIGIDLENGARTLPWPAMAERYFRPEEAAEVSAAPPDVVAEMFLTFWAAKEAITKAAGLGIPATLHSIAVPPLSSGKAAATHALDRDWHLVPFRGPAPLLGVLASDAPPSRVRWLLRENRR